MANMTCPKTGKELSPDAFWHEKYKAEHEKHEALLLTTRSILLKSINQALHLQALRGELHLDLDIATALCDSIELLAE